MTGENVVALVTAIGVSFAAIVTSFAALRNAKYNARIVEDLQAELIELKLLNTRNWQRFPYSKRKRAGFDVI